MLKQAFTNLKKIISIFLLLCLCMPIATVFVWLQYRKIIARKEAKKTIIAGIKSENLTLLKFTSKEAPNKIRWEHAQEFEYQGQMYDVVRTEQKNDTIFYWCWQDHAETHINVQIASLTLQNIENDAQSKRAKINALKFYAELFWVKENVFHFFSITLLLKPTAFCASTPITQAQRPPLPPPRKIYHKSFIHQPYLPA